MENVKYEIIVKVYYFSVFKILLHFKGFWDARLKFEEKNFEILYFT